MKERRATEIGRRLKGLMLRHVYGMITCREFEEFINAYQESELPSRERSRFEMHLRVCRECRQYLAAYQQTIEVGRAVFTTPDEPLPDNVPEGLIQAILKLRKGDKANE